MQTTKETTSPSGQMDENHKSFLAWLVGFNNALKRENLDMNEIQTLMAIYDNIRKQEKRLYYKSLVLPEEAIGCKIPSPFPSPSVSFQLHQSLLLSPNSAGYLVGVFNPYFLQQTTSGVDTYSTLYINNNPALTGFASSNFFVPTASGQVIPAGIYQEYRVVSAALKLSYIGRLDIVQGTVGIAQVNDPNIGIGDVTTAAVNANLQKYGDINLAQREQFRKEFYTLDGVRGIFIPQDTTFDQYIPLGMVPPQARTGFGLVFYIQDGVYAAGTSNYKLELFINYEVQVDASFLQYIPRTMPETEEEESARNQAKFLARKYLLTSASGPDSSVLNNSNSIFESTKSWAGQNFLPSLARLSSMIPGIGKIEAPLIMEQANRTKEESPFNFNISKEKTNI